MIIIAILLSLAGLFSIATANPFRRQTVNQTEPNAIMMPYANISLFCEETAVSELNCYAYILCEWDSTTDLCIGSEDHIARINDAVCYGTAVSACTDQRCTVVEGENCEGSSAYAQVQQETDGTLDAVLENIVMPFDNGTWVNPEYYCGYTFITSSSCSTSSICLWDSADGMCNENDAALVVAHTSICAPFTQAECVTDLRCSDEDTGCQGGSDFIVSVAH
eukprot:CFRG7275T1